MNAASHRWRCACCGEEFTGLPMDMGFSEPVDWESLNQETRAASWVDEDFCEVRHSSGEINRFIRGLLPLPVLEFNDAFRFLVWISVSEKSWDVYRAGFGKDDYALEGCFGYLMHDIPDYPGSYSLPVDVWFQPGGMRPTVELHDAHHPLVAAQRQGIEVAQIARWTALSHTG